MKTFKDLHLIQPLLDAVAQEGYQHPTPIQEKAIPVLLAGKDVLGCAQTGTGKTAAFALPILQALSAEPQEGKRDAQALILAPTRELAAQIGDSFTAYGRNTKVVSTVIYGGVAQGPQNRAVRGGLDVIVATPGRLLDLMGQAIVSLNAVRFLVLDEADRMLDMGFMPDVYRIVRRVPLRRQTMLFSATLPHEIVSLAKEILHEPVRIDIAPSMTTVETVRQLVYRVPREKKSALLCRLVLAPEMKRGIVFTRTKEGANKVVADLNYGPLRADVMHADRGQSAREKTLERFKEGVTKVLVATDIASRGLDVEGITHVYNYDVPDEPDSYVHRIGRTARAGAHGLAITLCSKEEERKLASIERAIRLKIPEGREGGRTGGHGGGHAVGPEGHAVGHAPAMPHAHDPSHGAGHGHALQEPVPAGQAHGHAHAGGHGHAHGHSHGHAHAEKPAHKPEPTHDTRHGMPMPPPEEGAKKISRLRQRHPRRR